MSYRVVFLFLIISFLAACGEPEDDNMLEDFELEGKWFFEVIEGDGIIYGLPQADKDENPEGYVEFFADGTGFADFSFVMLGFVVDN